MEETIIKRNETKLFVTAAWSKPDIRHLSFSLHVENSTSRRISLIKTFFWLNEVYTRRERYGFYFLEIPSPDNFWNIRGLFWFSKSQIRFLPHGMSDRRTTEVEFRSSFRCWCSSKFCKILSLSAWRQLFSRNEVTSIKQVVYGTILTWQTFRSEMSDNEALKQHLADHGWPTGLRNALAAGLIGTPSRFFICDDSGSMMSNDGHRLVGSGELAK